MKAFSGHRFCTYVFMLLTVLFLLGFTGKETKSDNGLYGITMEMPEQPGLGDNILTLIIRDGKSKRIVEENLFIEVVPWMALHEHGTKVAAVVSSQGGGKYLVEKVNFTMPGPWEVHLRISRGTVEDTAVFEVEVMGKGH